MNESKELREVVEEAEKNIPSFQNLGVSSKILSILSELKIVIPTPIQQQAIPDGLQGKDIIGVAQTGTGKTLAFGIPLIEYLAKHKDQRDLIVLLSRELAFQVEETLLKIGKAFGLRTSILMGGIAIHSQVLSLRRNPHMVIATPGRLLDHLKQGTIKLNQVSMFVLDEADRMLDMGFWPQIKQILLALPVRRQTMLFSATLSKEVMEVATKYMQLPVSIEVAPPGTTAENVTQEFFIVQKEDKSRLLEKVLAKYSGSVLIFARTKYGAKKVMRGVLAMGHKAAEIHGNRSLTQRRDALEGFKAGRYRVLVATDIASRGIDVKGIQLVVNFDLPMDTSDYVHRIGRTARAGAEGHAISFVMPNERRDIREIERLIRMSVPISQTGDLPPERVVHMPPRDQRPQRSFSQKPKKVFHNRHTNRHSSFHGKNTHQK